MTTDTPETKTSIPYGLKEFTAFVDDLGKESDRAAAIIVAAKCDILLKELIAKFLLPSHTTSDELLDGDSPLGTFTSRINFAYRAGLIKADFARALHFIRRIRNEFAHEPSSATLESGPHKDRIRELASPFKISPSFDGLTKNLFGNDNPGSEFRACAAIVSLRLQRAIQTCLPVTEQRAHDLVLPSEKPASASKAADA